MSSNDIQNFFEDCEFLFYSKRPRARQFIQNEICGARPRLKFATNSSSL